MIKSEIQIAYTKIMRMLAGRESLPADLKDEKKDDSKDEKKEKKKRDVFVNALEFIVDNMDALMAANSMKKIVVMTDGLDLEDLAQFDDILVKNYHFMSFDFIITGLIYA